MMVWFVVELSTAGNILHVVGAYFSPLGDGVMMAWMVAQDDFTIITGDKWKACVAFVFCILSMHVVFGGCGNSHVSLFFLCSLLGWFILVKRLSMVALFGIIHLG